MNKKYLSDVRVYTCLPNTVLLSIPNSKNLPLYTLPLSLLEPCSIGKESQNDMTSGVIPASEHSTTSPYENSVLTSGGGGLPLWMCCVQAGLT